MFGLEAIVEERETQLKEAINRLKQDVSEKERMQVLLLALSEIKKAIQDSVVDKVKVTNQDEIKAALHNEVTRLLNPLLAAIKAIEFPEINIPEPQKFPEQIKITNLSEIAPKDVVINLDELKDGLNNVLLAIQSLQLNPSINVEAPTVNVPEPRVDVNIPEFPKFPDLKVDGILKALEPLKYISDRPNKPISVRIASADGKKFLDLLEKIKESSQKQVAAFSQSTGLTRKEFRAVQQEISGISLPKFDYVSRTLSAATQETYVFKTGGSSGTTVSTVVVNYTDSSLNTLSDVTRT